MIYGLLIGVSGYGVGLWLSTLLDMPSGAVIVWLMAVFALLSLLLHKKKPHTNTQTWIIALIAQPHLAKAGAVTPRVC